MEKEQKMRALALCLAKSERENSEKMSTIGQTQFQQNQTVQIMDAIKDKRETLLERVEATLRKTDKADKYVRLICNIVKMIRLRSPEMKMKFGALYKQLLVLRQVFRWNGLYENISEYNKLGMKVLRRQNLFHFAFSIFTLYGDLLDRAIFVLELLDSKKYSGLLNRLSQIQSDCYFVECIIWLFYHIKTRQTCTEQERKMKWAKIVKYSLDCLTSYSKFSGARVELSPQLVGILGLTSSVIGLFSILA